MADTHFSPFLMYPDVLVRERHAIASPRITTLQVAASRVPAFCKHRFIYGGSGMNVAVIGDWLKWDAKRQIKLDPIPGQPFFFGDANLPLGIKLRYKFIVNGQWRIDPALPHEPDEFGNTNNYLFTPQAQGVKVEAMYRHHVDTPGAADSEMLASPPGGDGSDGTAVEYIDGRMEDPAPYIDEKVVFLFQAVKQNFASRIQSLIENEGVDVNTTHPALRKTALHQAVESAYAETNIPDSIIMLLSLGCDPEVKDGDGRTVRELANRLAPSSPMTWFFNHPLIKALAKTSTNTDSVTFRRRSLLVLSELAVKRSMKEWAIKEPAEVSNRISLKRLMGFSSTIGRYLLQVVSTHASLVTLYREVQHLRTDIAARLDWVRGLRDVDRQVELETKARDKAIVELQGCKVKIVNGFSDGVQQSVKDLIEEVELKLAEIVTSRIEELRDGVGTWQEREQSLVTTAKSIQALETEVAAERDHAAVTLKAAEEEAASWTASAATAIEGMLTKARAAETYLRKRLTQIDQEMKIAEEAVIDNWKGDLLQEKIKTERNLKEATDWCIELETELHAIRLPHNSTSTDEQVLAETNAVQARVRSGMGMGMQRARSKSSQLSLVPEAVMTVTAIPVQDGTKQGALRGM
ncbi:hypothetical protein M427DRAFT_319235 [Gonapodya prolifera JEL478]|uniref:AMP-activated protein kinase glycogen-binding domain-containing protein n=1 Tax=Gonapodya prolifera (strain JEL478) TaxID=1344416 RepID=A0A139AXX9_GONPJ|nr:hypothetical protein M427DRAFT_319235 [Gonapodya prolifera JEL478]|eukprot:KXS21423.1 hypothetical protein M427DRAFT_319235 [Gonapodya prolifera JEL478]